MLLTPKAQKRFQRLTLLLVCVFGWGFADAVVAAPSTFRVDGYSVEANWRVIKKHRRFVVWGNVKNGKKCKQLMLNISFENDKVPHIEQVSAIIENYEPIDTGMEYNIKVKAFTKKSRSDWLVKDINLRCSR